MPSTETSALCQGILARGAKHLTDADLLSVVLNSSSLARSLTRNSPKWWAIGQHELGKIPRFNDNRVAQLLGLVELAGRITSVPFVRGEVFRCSEQVAEAYGPRLVGSDQEVFLVVSLDARNRVIAEQEAARGTMNSIMIDPRLVFRKLLGDGAASAIMVHNHPSGDVSPSVDDVKVCERLAEAGRVIGIKLIDFVIVGGGKSTSFADMGLIPGEKK